MGSKYSNERKSCASLTLSHKLELIKLKGEVMLEAQTGQKQGLLSQIAKLWM